MIRIESTIQPHDIVADTSEELIDFILTVDELQQDSDFTEMLALRLACAWAEVVVTKEELDIFLEKMHYTVQSKWLRSNT